MLDEPTASLPADEVKRLFAALRPLRAKGVGMIDVSDRLDEVFQLSDRVAVLRVGQLVGMRDKDPTNAEDLVSLIVGRKAREIARPEAQDGPELLSATALATRKAGPLDFCIRRGEMVGLVGLRGAGHEEIGRALFGLEKHTGVVTLDGVAPDLTSPRGAMKSGIGFVARDRVVESVAPTLSIRENTFLNPSATGRRLASFMAPKTENALASDLGARVGLVPNDPTLAIEALSGGNQQKVVVGRWLDTGRRLLIAEDPTAGVDVGAKAEIYTCCFRRLPRASGC